MIYENAVDEVKEQRQIEPQMIALAKVTSLTDGKALVQFYGESTPSTKAYPYIEGYKPTVNDIVCMIAQGNTYIIVGKVTNDNITTNYDVKKSELDSVIAGLASVYLTQSNAANTYLTQSNAANTYLTQSSASSTYLSKTDAASTYLSQSDASTYYLTKNAASNTYLTQTSASGTYLSKSTASSTYLSQTDASNTYLSKSSASSTYLSKSDASNTYLHANMLVWSGRVLRNYYTYDAPSLGDSSHKFADVYASDLYGTTHSSSDKRLKKNIKNLGKKWLDFFYKLKPKSFKYKNGTSGRTHTGFIAQEVEQAANEVGIETKDIAAVTIDPSGQYYLGYEELISVLTLAIQDLNERVKALEGRKKE